ncbi:NAD(P)-dependent dehydrogenase (short-subunit alcohol dehydrogenase family) [Prauserella shujinwangii]|uniref:NAD(P)-dependent dehydrogenase (Short-subunit alcohol dehydrogenase family) n=1 Tax=Prauserella shujinwangii TaxID=1453103 RepID=A0A2T0M3Z3_9PSEU|nr:SDR family NAD(P)-dependent oxidoreductase [Prauserella shujinwangii]PRX51463.1 NAD(P)-dependent dehydrogenase (short-subunit alcohol dehydrogenase family) [Prauserella shujinwangii]
MGQIAVITGATAGIGLACAKRLLADGATVVVSGRSAERGREAVAGLAAGDRARYIPCDVTDPRQVTNLVEETIDTYRRIDVLVNNAGGVTDDGRPIAELDDDALDRAFTLNVDSAFWACRAVLPHMLPRGYGRIVNMASIAGKTGAAGLVGYTTAKHALVGYTKTLAKEVTTRGITANAVCPGITDTEMIPRELQGAIEATGADFGQAAAHYTGDLGRMVEPSEVAALVGVLASPQAGAISGAAISVDGGFTQY